MKKIFLALCAISALLISCKEKDSSGTSTKSEKQVVNTRPSAKSLIIYTGWILSTEKDDGKMYAVKEAETGDSVKIYLNEDGSIIQKKATRRLSSGKEDEVNFVSVQFDGEDYWIRDIFLSGIGDGEFERYNTLGVAIADTFAYDSPSGAGLTSRQIKEGTVIAFRENQAEGDNGFFKVVIYNGNPFGKEIWLKDETIVTNTTAIEIIRTLDKLNRKVEKEEDKIKPVIRDEILARLIKDSQLDDYEIAKRDVGLSNEMQEYFIKKLNEIRQKALKEGEPLPEDLSEKIENIGFNFSAQYM